MRDFNDELDGYVYLPRMFDKARARLAGTTTGPQFGCPLDHTAMARLGVYPEQVLDLARAHGDDDRAILAGLHEIGIPDAEEIRFDAQATEDDELLQDIYLRVRPLDRIDEIEARPGDVVLTVDRGEALISLGDRQRRIVRAGQVVRIPPDFPHTVEQHGSEPLVVNSERCS